MPEKLPYNPYEQMQQAMQPVVEAHVQARVTEEFPARAGLMNEAKSAAATGEPNRYADTLPSEDRAILSLTAEQQQVLKATPEGETALKQHQRKAAVHIGRLITAHRNEELSRIRGETNDRFDNIEEFWGSAPLDVVPEEPEAPTPDLGSPDEPIVPEVVLHAPEPEIPEVEDVDDDIVDAEVVEDEPTPEAPDDDEIIDAEVVEDEPADEPTEVVEPEDEEPTDTLPETEEDPATEVLPPVDALPYTRENLENLEFLAGLTSDELYDVIDDVRLLARDLQGDAVASGARIDTTRGDAAARGLAWEDFTNDQLGYMQARNIMNNALRILGSKEGWSGAERDSIEQHYMQPGGTRETPDAPDTRQPTFGRTAFVKRAVSTRRDARRNRVKPEVAEANAWRNRFDDMQDWKLQWLRRHPGNEDADANHAFVRAHRSWELVEPH